jgi:hypothetical protein
MDMPNPTTLEPVSVKARQAVGQTCACTVADCNQPHIARGFCGKHYQRFKKANRKHIPKLARSQQAQHRRKSSLKAYYKNLDESRRKGREKSNRKRRERILLVNKIKLEAGCIDCGYADDPVALHFDHRDPSQKLFTIAKGLTRALDKLLAEIAKCDVRCANCHAIKSVKKAELGCPHKE